MVETSSTRDAFARRGAPGADRMSSGADHFKRPADKSAGDHFRSPGGPAFDPARPKQDAFAKKSGSPKPPSQKPVKAAKPAPALAAAAQAEPAKAEPARPAPAKPVEPVVVAALTPAAPEIATKRGLHVVPSETPAAEKIEARVEAKPQAAVDDLMFAPASRPESKRPETERVEADARQRPAGKTSSLVLVTGGGLAAASSVDTLDKPAPVETPPPPPKPEASVPPPAEPERVRSGGGGGGSGGGGTGGKGVAAAAARKSGIDQDDIVGIVLGVVILALLLLWLLRGKEGSEEIAGGDPMVSTQFAATDTGPPETFTPLVDPFGDGVVDLTPKGPIPEAAPEASPAPADAGASSATETALLETPPQAAAVAPVPAPTRAPAPAAAATPPPVAATPPSPAAIPGITSHAWFCTGSAELTEAARSGLLASIVAFRPYAGEPLVVHAFADTRGTSVFNLALSGARARVVADFLRANGMSVLEFEGKGELPGLADDRNCANQRRADIFLKAGSEYRPSAACVPPEEKSAAICS
jgi:outer membrane protein OmpA-like peptidoglycan-associated protein